MKKNNIQHTLDMFNSVRIPTAKCKQVHKDSDSKKFKKGNRGMKYKPKYD